MNVRLYWVNVLMLDWMNVLMLYWLNVLQNNYEKGNIVKDFVEGQWPYYKAYTIWQGYVNRLFVSRSINEMIVFMVWFRTSVLRFYQCSVVQLDLMNCSLHPIDLSIRFNSIFYNTHSFKITFNIWKQTHTFEYVYLYFVYSTHSFLIVFKIS